MMNEGAGSQHTFHVCPVQSEGCETQAKGDVHVATPIPEIATTPAKGMPMEKKRAATEKDITMDTRRKQSHSESKARAKDTCKPGAASMPPFLLPEEGQNYPKNVTMEESATKGEDVAVAVIETPDGIDEKMCTTLGTNSASVSFTGSGWFCTVTKSDITPESIIKQHYLVERTRLPHHKGPPRHHCRFCDKTS